MWLYRKRCTCVLVSKTWETFTPSASTEGETLRRTRRLTRTATIPSVMIGITWMAITWKDIARRQGEAEAGVEKGRLIHALIARAVKKPHLGVSQDICLTERRSGIHKEENTRVANANVQKVQDRAKQQGPNKNRTLKETAK